MTDACTISIKSGLQQDARLIHCNCQAAYSGDTLSQQIATIFLPGGELQGANTPIHYRCSGDASIYDVELRSLDGLTTHATRTLDNVSNIEWYVTLDTDFTVPPGGDWDNQFVRLFVNGQYKDASYFVGGTASLAPYAGTQFHIGHDGAGSDTVWGLLRIGVS